MTTGQPPSGEPQVNRFTTILFSICGGVGCFLGVWFGPRITGWSDPNSPDPFSALAGMGVAFAIATIIKGLVSKAPPKA